MQREISNGTMLGIILLALAAIIGLCFGVFMIAKGTGNEGVVKTQTELDRFMSLELEAYNDKRVMGRDVLSLLKKNRDMGDNLSIFVNTKKTVPDTVLSINNDLYVQYMAGKAYVNYGTLLTLPMEPDYSLQMVDKNDELSEYDDTLIWKDGTVYSEGVYVTDDAGRLVTYNEIGDCYKQSSREYIDTNSHFDASWILDVTGEIIGVCFTQLQY